MNFFFIILPFKPGPDFQAIFNRRNYADQMLPFCDGFEFFGNFSPFIGVFNDFWPQSRFFERQNLLIWHQQVTAFQIEVCADLLSQTAGPGRNRLQNK